MNHLYDDKGKKWQCEGEGVGVGRMIMVVTLTTPIHGDNCFVWFRKLFV